MSKSIEPGRRRSSDLVSGKNAYGPKVPTVLAKIFGPPPLVGDEDPELFAELFNLYVAKHDPKEIDEWMLVHDKTILRWELLRERRLRAEVIKIYQEQSNDESKQPILVFSPNEAMY